MLRLLRLSPKQSRSKRQARAEAASPQPVLQQPGLQYKRIALRPIEALEKEAWQRIHNHFRDKEIAHLNGTKPSRMPLWLLRRVLKTDAKRIDRETFGIYASLPTSDTSKQKATNTNSEIANPDSSVFEFNKTSTFNQNNPKDRNNYGSYYYHQFPEYIGTVELYDMNKEHATLGIIIGEKDYWSKGYGPEAIYALLCHAFDTIGLKRVRLNTYGDNLRAQRSFKRIGFVETKRIKNFKGREDVYMEIKRDAWQEFLRNPPPWHMNYST